jgi:hypothetical protein
VATQPTLQEQVSQLGLIATEQIGAPAIQVRQVTQALRWHWRGILAEVNGISGKVDPSCLNDAPAVCHVIASK